MANKYETISELLHDFMVELGLETIGTPTSVSIGVAVIAVIGGLPLASALRGSQNVNLRAIGDWIWWFAVGCGIGAAGLTLYFFIVRKFGL